MKAPEDLNISPQEGDALIERIEHDACTPEDRQTLVHVLRLYFWLIFALQESKLSLKRLRIIIFGKPKNKKRSKRDSDSDGNSATSEGDKDVEGSGGDPDEPADSVTAEPPETGQTDGESGKGGKRKGHGRLGEGAYVGAKRVECRHENLVPGDRCSLCGHGTLYQLPPSRPIRIDGHAALSAIRYELERLRCSACGEVFAAKMPAEAGTSKYNAQARAAIVMNRYFLGVPFYRLETYQSLVGVPVPDATQWDQVEHVADCSYMVFEHLVYLAAQGQLIYQDDTPVRTFCHSSRKTLSGKPLKNKRHKVRSRVSVPACRAPRWWSKPGSIPSVCIFPVGIMPGKTCRGCWNNVKPALISPSSCLMRCREMTFRQGLDEPQLRRC